MISLKDLIFTEDKELTLWYQQFRHNLLDLLENVFIDKICGSAAYQIVIMKDEYDEFRPMIGFLCPEFTHKNTYGK